MAITPPFSLEMDAPKIMRKLTSMTPVAGPRETGVPAEGIEPSVRREQRLTIGSSVHSAETDWQDCSYPKHMKPTTLFAMSLS